MIVVVANSIKSIWVIIYPEITKLWAQQWKQEDITGDSKIIYKINQYYYAGIYSLLVNLQAHLQNKTVEEIKTEFEYTKYSKCLACHGVDLDVIFDIVSSNFSTCGISYAGINESFEVGLFTNCGTNSPTSGTTYLDPTTYVEGFNCVEHLNDCNA